MSSLKEIRNRITSIKNTRQVTNAMKMVSAAKLKKAQDTLSRIIPFDKKLHEVLLNMAQGDLDDSPFFKTESEPQNVLIVVVGTNRGLCGAFNVNVAKTAMQHVYENYNYQYKLGKLNFLVIGRQLEKQFKTVEPLIMGEAHELLSDLTYENVSEIADRLMKMYLEGRYQRIDVIYNRYKNAAVQVLSTDQFLPLTKPTQSKIENKKLDYINEPSRDEVLNTVIPQSLKVRFFRTILDSNTAEQGARMSAMHQATDNATELMKELKTTYNNARQAAITNEIMEITAGAEALRNA
jgi:F-type H+-transporting ATPase subunit gamma